MNPCLQGLCDLWLHVGNQHLLAGVSALTALTALRLACRSAADDSALAELRGLTALRCLEISGICLCHLVVNGAQPQPTLPSVTHLAVRADPVRDAVS